MALSEEQKNKLAKQLAEKRRVMGDTAFQSYLGKVEQAIPQRQAQQTAQITEDTAALSKPKGVTGFLGRVTGVEGLGRGVAAMINAPAEEKRRNAMLAENEKVQNDLIQGLKDARARGDSKAVDNIEKELEKFSTEASARIDGMRQRADLGVTNRDVIGSALRTFGTIASAGSFGGKGAVTGQLSKVAAPQLTNATTIGRGVLQGSLQGLKTGATSGAIFGGVSGTATGIEQGKGVLGTAFEAAKQAAVGGVLGGALGTVVGGVGGGFQAKANRKEELAQLLSRGNTVDEALTKPNTLDLSSGTKTTLPNTSGKPNVATAGYKLDGTKVVPDKPAQNLLKQGIDDRNVAVMQSFSPEDTNAAREMVKIAKEVKNTGIATQRQQEVVGKAFMSRAKDVEKLNSVAGRQIDDIARNKLSGASVNASAATDDFFNQLQRAGVDVDQLRLAETPDDTARAFDGSDFEGIATAQKTIKNVLKRVDPALEGADMDGLALHKAKRFIDNQVTYGKNAEGLTGDAERLLKGLRSGIDDVLDTTFPDYNKANTQYKETIEALDEMRRLIGRDFVGSGDIANLRAGEVMNRLLGNASAKPLSALQNLENVSTKYGNKYTDSLIKQITFADLLDDVYQTVPSRGFQGGVQRGVEGATSGFLGKMRQGGLISATIESGAEAVQSARGITPEKAQEAIEAYLGLTVK